MEESEAAQQELARAEEQLHQQQTRFQKVTAPGQAEQCFTHKVCLELGEMGTRVLEALDALPPGLPPELRERKRALTRETLAFLDKVQATYKQVDQRRTQSAPSSPARGAATPNGTTRTARHAGGPGPKPSHPAQPPLPAAASQQHGPSERRAASASPQRPERGAPWERAAGAARQYWDKMRR